MPSVVRDRSGRSRRSRPTVPATLSTALVTVGAVAATLVLPSSTAAASAAPAAPADGVTVVQANIKSGIALERLRSDVRTVMAEQPDVVTYNEVPFRRDAEIVPSGYAIYRDTTDRYTAATPVVWRTDRWRLLDSGTKKISGYTQIPAGKHTKLGLRYANWVTLESTDGRRLSVASVHVPPLTRGMPDLERPTVRRIGGLVQILAERGPVIVGGDFNAHYRSRLRYPRDLLDAAGMVPTYDTLGSYFPTGDHGGSTIDYLFNRGEGQLVATAHYGRELESDHDAVVGRFGWTVDSPSTVTRAIAQSSDLKSQRTLVKSLVSQVRTAQRGDAVDVFTSKMRLHQVYRQLRWALGRGAHVRLITQSSTPTWQERRLGRLIRQVGDRHSRIVSCVKRCGATVRAADVPKTMLLVSRRGVPRVRVDLDRRLNETFWTGNSSMTSYTGSADLAHGRDTIAALKAAAR